MRRLSCPVALLAFALTACNRSDPPGEGRVPPPPNFALSLTRAREMGPGKVADVTATVNVPSGSVDAGFTLQQGSRGLYVAADSGTRVERGQVVRVIGRLEDRHGLLTLVPDSVRTLGRAAPHPAYTLGTKRVGEDTEALLVVVRGRITAPVVDDRPYGWKITIDDGSGPLQIFVPAHQAFDLAAYRVGQTLTVEGMSAQYDATYEVITTAPLKLSP